MLRYPSKPSSKNSHSRPYYLAQRLPAKALRTYFRKLRPVLPLSILLFCLLIFLFPLPFAPRPSFNPLPRIAASAIEPDVVGRTDADTPIIAMPEPYGYGGEVMARVLKSVIVYIKGGDRCVGSELQQSVDEKHHHGSMIGRDPLTKVAVWTPTPFDFSKETDEMKTQAHEKSCYNKRRSNALPLDRDIPDVRAPKCMKQWYYGKRTRGITEMVAADGKVTEVKMLTSSVIFVFYNEPLSPLLRAIYSVLDRTPVDLLHEIILVDDGSDIEAPWLGDGAEFERHLQLLPKTRLARLEGRNGLMKARNVGASLATGETITFLDAHIEVNEGWLEPMVGRIVEGLQEGINRVVVPVIDSVDADNFKYSAGGIDVLGHTWGLGQTGIVSILHSKSVEPARSPIMAGGLLCLTRKYFDELGYYDPEMKLWGGEEMEISFRIWLCGGTLECVPCSRVGHVFRSSKYWQGQVYKVPGEVISKNKRRASFWMDDYQSLAQLSAAPFKAGENLGSMKHYTDIKERLQCKPYQWYLENVYPQLLEGANKLMGKGKVSFVGSGFLRNNGSNTCLDHLQYKGDGQVFGSYPCHYLRGSQSAAYTNTHLLLSGDFLLDGCLTAEDGATLTRRKCTDELEAAQKWEMEEMDGGYVLMKNGGKCLTVVRIAEVEDKSPVSLRMKPCSEENDWMQMWDWEILSDPNGGHDGAGTGATVLSQPQVGHDGHVEGDMAWDDEDDDGDDDGDNDGDNDGR